MPPDYDYFGEIISRIERLLEAQHENVSATAGLNFEGSGEKPYQTHSLALTLVNTIDERRLTSLEMGEFPDETSPGEEEKISTHHWLPDVYNQPRPATLLEDTGHTGQEAFLFGPDMPGSPALLDESYTKLIEVPFEGDLLVTIYHRSHDGRSRILCRIVRPPHLQKVCDLPLVSLLIERNGPFLKLLHVDASEAKPKLWACLKFPDYEGTFVDHCSLYP